MTLTIVVGVLLVAAGLTWLSLPSKPTPQEPLTSPWLARLLEVLLYQGVDGSTFTIYVKQDDRYLRLEKYLPTVGTGPVGIRVALPNETWADQYIVPMCEQLDRRSVPYDRPVLRSHGNAVVSVDVRADLTRAKLVTEVAFEHVFGVRLATECVGYFEDVLPMESPRLAGISRPAGS